MNREIEKMIGYFLLVASILFFIAGCSPTISGETEIKVKKVDCFDKYGNKIIGEVCEEEYYELNNLAFLFALLYIVCFFGGLYLLTHNGDL